MAFACDLVAAMQPEVFVELGTHFGESYFAFCQAIQEQKIPCHTFAVDRWSGDQQMGPYDEDVFEEVEAWNQSHYAGFSSLLRMTFDEAVNRFPNESIDLLHMDGLATYGAVRHDFDTWLPKLKPGAIVLLHYATERHEVFDVHRCWLELCERYQTFAFSHHGGLGVLRIPGPARETGVLEVLFGKDTLLQKRLVAYYDVCASRLAEDKQKTGEWETRTQVFWRAAKETFCEPRSAQRWHTLQTTPTTVCIKLPPLDAPEVLRLDIADRRTRLFVHQVSLLGTSGRRFWFRKGSKFFEDVRFAGMRVFPTGGRALVIVKDKDCFLELPLDDALRAELARGAVMELELRGIATDLCIDALADRLWFGISKIKMLRSRLEVESPGRNGTSETAVSDDDQTTLSDLQRLITERDDEICRLRAALDQAVRRNLRN